jgi:DNA-binding XRE family transcriptional regulator
VTEVADGPYRARAVVGELTRPTTSVEAGARLAGAAYLLHRSGDSALLVRDDDGAQTVGLLSVADIVHAVAAGLDPERTRVWQIVGTPMGGGVDAARPARVGAIALGELRTARRPRRARDGRGCSGAPERIGPMVRRLRLRADLTLEGLSQQSGVSDRALSDIEREVARGPQHRTVLAIARALELSEADRAALLDAARAGRFRPASSRPRAEAAWGRPVLVR